MSDGKKTKAYISLSPEMNSYFEGRAKASGQSKSAAIGMALLEYFEMKNAVKVLGDVSEMMKSKGNDDK